MGEREVSTSAQTEVASTEILDLGSDGFRGSRPVVEPEAGAKLLKPRVHAPTLEVEGVACGVTEAPQSEPALCPERSHLAPARPLLDDVAERVFEQLVHPGVRELAALHRSDVFGQAGALLIETAQDILGEVLADHDDAGLVGDDDVA